MCTCANTITNIQIRNDRYVLATRFGAYLRLMPSPERHVDGSRRGIRSERLFLIKPPIVLILILPVLRSPAGQLVIDSSETLFGGGQIAEADRLQERAGFYRTGACDAGSECLPLSECTYVMQYQAARTCLTGDRSMSCGSTSLEPYVCCPRGRVETVHACGKSLVAGQFYKGLGSFPFVARIGFKSECARRERECRQVCLQ